MSLVMKHMKTATEQDPRWRSVVNRDADVTGDNTASVRQNVATVTTARVPPPRH